MERALRALAQGPSVVTAAKGGDDNVTEERCVLSCVAPRPCALQRPGLPPHLPRPAACGMSVVCPGFVDRGRSGLSKVGGHVQFCGSEFSVGPRVPWRTPPPRCPFPRRRRPSSHAVCPMAVKVVGCPPSQRMWGGEHGGPGDAAPRRGTAIASAGGAGRPHPCPCRGRRMHVPPDGAGGVSGRASGGPRGPSQIPQRASV